MLSISEVRPAGLTMLQKIKAGWSLPVDSATQLAMEFKCMLRYLQFFGSLPVHLVPKDGEDMKLEFKAKVLCRQTIFPTMTSAIFFSLLWIKHIAECVYGRSLSANQVPKNDEMFFNFSIQSSGNEDCSGCLTLGKLWETSCFLIPIQSILMMVASWVDAPTFAKLFNEWVKLETEFFDACCWTARVKKDVTQNILELDASSITLLGLPEWRKRYYLYLVVIPMMVVLPPYFYTNLYFQNVMNDAIAVSVALHFIVYPCVIAMTAAIMYRCMSRAFHQTCGAMVSAVESGQLDLDLVSSWRCFIEKLREQSKLLAKAYTRMEFIYVGSMFLMLTLIIFTLFNGNRDARGATQVMTVLALYGIGNLLTLLIKVCAAEQITHEESAIASLVASVQTRDSLVFQELKFIHEIIAMRPSEISVGNYITLNRRLVLSLIGQISTYLIVLMQFSQKQCRINNFKLSGILV